MEGLKNTEEMDLCFFLSYGPPSKGVCLQVLEGHGDELRDFKATPKNQLHNRATEATLPKFNIALECPWKMMVGRLLSYWEGNFSGAMLNFGRVIRLDLGPGCW